MALGVSRPRVLRSFEAPTDIGSSQALASPPSAICVPALKPSRPSDPREFEGQVPARGLRLGTRIGSGCERHKAAKATSLSRCSSSAAYFSETACPRAAASTTSLSYFRSSAAYFSADPFLRTAAVTISLSERSSSAANFRARPFFRTAVSTTSLSRVRSSWAYFNAQPSRCTAASTTERSPRRVTGTSAMRARCREDAHPMG
mmetsp:Transcript_53104/g.119707  ORF Transcript_53104/g.119707 Transcript_53104/m.119707 type:complete len:203 (+) Transcript_53104:244-852(+)